MNGSKKYDSITRRGDACHRPDLLWQNAKAGRTPVFAPTKNVFLTVFALLMACAPARVTQSSNTVAASNTGIVSLVVNPNGDTICVAQNATSVALFSRAAIRGQSGHEWLSAPTRVSSAAWLDNTWWFALPRVGLVQTAVGVPKSVAVLGQPTRLSARHILTLERDVFNFSGSRVTRFSSLPQDVLELPSSTYFLVGKEVFVLQNGQTTRVKELDSAQYSLLPENNSFVAVKGMAVRNADYTFVLEKSEVRISRHDLNAFRTISLPSTGSKIAIGGDTLAVALGLSVAFYDARTFAPLLTRACEVTR